MWCLKYRNVNLENYVFVDETTIQLCDFPLFHLRLPKKNPLGFPSTRKQRGKVNIWGGISYEGPTPFAVKLIQLKFYFRNRFHSLPKNEYFFLAEKKSKKKTLEY
jgi:hypothetical protein